MENADPTLTYIIQGGCLALLGIIVIFLTRFIPKRMEAADRLAELEIKARESIADKHSRDLDMLIKTFSDQQKYEREQCHNQFTELLNEQKEQTLVLERLSLAIANNQKPPRRS